jgi:hypothetical protein
VSDATTGVHSDPSGDEMAAYARSPGAELCGVASAEAYASRFPSKPAPARFVEGARPVVVIGLPFQPGTVATVLRPDLAGLRARATDGVAAPGALPAGPERFFASEENAVLSRELAPMGEFLRHTDTKTNRWEV